MQEETMGGAWSTQASGVEVERGEMSDRIQKKMHPQASARLATRWFSKACFKQRAERDRCGGRAAPMQEG